MYTHHDMMNREAHSRTRQRLIEAFNQLVFAKTPSPIRVGQIVAKAGVGRSTFYDHFANAEAVHMAALSRPLAPLADALAGHGNAASIQWMLDHFFANRARARATLIGSSRDRVARLLADLIDQRLPQDVQPAIPRRLATAQIAEAALVPIRLWICGEAAANSAALAKSLFDTAAAMRIALGLESVDLAATGGR